MNRRAFVLGALALHPLLGQTPGSFPAKNWIIQDGRPLTESDVENARDVCVLGNSLAKTLFPFGSGGHLPEPRERPVPVSLKAWAKWALTHHNRKYVFVPFLLP